MPLKKLIAVLESEHCFDLLKNVQLSRFKQNLSIIAMYVKTYCSLHRSDYKDNSYSSEVMLMEQCTAVNSTAESLYHLGDEFRQNNSFIDKK